MLCLLALGIGTTKAQEETASVTLVPSPKGEDSKEIISTIESDFGVGKPVEKVLEPLKHLSIRWKISKEQFDEFSHGMDVAFVEVFAKSDNETQNALYDSKGNLVQLSEVVFNAPLPETAKEIIDMKYKDWKVLGDKEIINTKDKRPDYFKVSVSNEKKKKALYFDENGNELNSHLKPTV